MSTQDEESTGFVTGTVTNQEETGSVLHELSVRVTVIICK